jgi:hypothetical protein
VRLSCGGVLRATGRSRISPWTLRLRWSSSGFSRPCTTRCTPRVAHSFPDPISFLSLCCLVPAPPPSCSTLTPARQGLIYRGRKPVYWSPSSRTALAEAELEYAEHTSPTAYAAFPTRPAPALAALLPAGEPVRVAAWTTTPWTLPANQAIAVNPDLTYVAVCADTRAGPGLVIVAEKLLESLTPVLFTGPVSIVATFPGTALAGSTYVHPLRADGCVRACVCVCLNDESDSGFDSQRDIARLVSRCCLLHVHGAGPLPDCSHHCSAPLPIVTADYVTDKAGALLI